MSMSETEFSRRMDEFCRSKNMPLKDICLQKEMIAQRVLHRCACEGKNLAEKEQMLWMYFQAFTLGFGSALPPGTRPLAEGSDSE